MPRAFIRGRSGLPPPASSKAVFPRPHKDFPMKKKDLRDLLSRAAAVIEDPTSESADDRDTLVEDLTEAASQVERFELVPIPNNDVERLRIILKTAKEVAIYTKMVALTGRADRTTTRLHSS